MKFLRDVPDTIVLNVSSQRTSNQTAKKTARVISKRSSQEVMKDIPFTLYTSRSKR